MPDSLRGHLLIAAPVLHDYFRRTVVLVIEHTPDGAMGVVLNRESETLVAEAVPQLAELAADEELVRIGGPVAPQSVVALGEFADPAEAGTQVVDSLGTLDPDADNASLQRIRVFAGYTGWAPGSSTWSSSRRPGWSLPRRPTMPSPTATSGPTPCGAREAATGCSRPCPPTLAQLNPSARSRPAGCLRQS